MLKLIGKILLAIVGIAMLAGAFLGYRIFYGTPGDVDTMATRQFVMYLREDPETLTLLGFADDTILDFHSDKLTPRDAAHRARSKQLLADYRAELDRYDRAELSGDQAMTWDVWTFWLDAERAASEPFYAAPIFGPYVIDQQDGVHGALGSTLLKNHRITGSGMAENFIARMEAYPEAAQDAITVFNDHADRGVLPPRFILQRVLGDIDSSMERAPENSEFVTIFADAEAAKGLDQSEREEFAARSEILVREQIYPALTKIRNAIAARLDQARVDQPGLLALPGGRDLYDAYILKHTTVDIEADAVHELGLAEVTRLRAEIDERMRALGYSEGATVASMALLYEQQNYGFGEGDAGRTALTAKTDTLVAGAMAASEPYFVKLPDAGVELRAIPPHLEDSASNSYSGPAQGNPGYFNLKMSEPERFSAAGYPSLVYHETVPGHHFQIARAREQGLSLLRANLPFTAFSEGWALYAEVLASEMGLYEDNPAGEIGRLRSELFRATRLVVDTGLHAKGWGRIQARDYMFDALYAEPGEGGFGEIDRYLVNPGQALAYKVGQLKILELRDRAKTALGDRFDIAQFHERVLEDGAIPLTVLEAKIDRWIAAERGGI